MGMVGSGRAAGLRRGRDGKEGQEGAWLDGSCLWNKKSIIIKKKLVVCQGSVQRYVGGGFASNSRSQTFSEH